MKFVTSHLSANRTASVALALALSACASHNAAPPAASADAEASATTSANSTTSANADEREVSVQISKTLRERCKLAEEQQNAPKFDFDQATLHASGRNVLDDVANCLKDGPLQSEVITLVGRTDARGGEQYNQSLAANRAVAVRNYLIQRGVPTDRIKLMSRGEQGASGKDEATFALDRRVDLELGDLKKSPILQGSLLQAETAAANKPERGKAASYADTAEGGKPVGNAAASPSPTAPGATSTSGSASGSVTVGGGTK
jgi:outer membrane protein OmpA-like peptidoglycan-associated protein